MRHEAYLTGWLDFWPSIDDEHHFTCEHRLYTVRFFGRFPLRFGDLLSFHLFRILPRIKKICYIYVHVFYPVNNLKITLY